MGSARTILIVLFVVVTLLTGLRVHLGLRSLDSALIGGWISLLVAFATRAGQIERDTLGTLRMRWIEDLSRLDVRLRKMVNLQDSLLERRRPTEQCQLAAQAFAELGELLRSVQNEEYAHPADARTLFNELPRALAGMFLTVELDGNGGPPPADAEVARGGFENLRQRIFAIRNREAQAAGLPAGC